MALSGSAESAAGLRKPDRPAAFPAAAPASASARVREAFFLLLATHFFVDCFSSTLPTVLPILAERFEFSLAQAGVLSGFWMLSSSVMQLPFGVLSDRLHSRLFTVLSPVAAAVFLTSMGGASGFGGLAVLLLLGGAGVAAYHPHSTSQAGKLAGSRRGIGTAVFITAGTAGLGLGPLYLTAVIERFGFDRLWVAALPVVAATPWLLWRVPRPVAGPHARERGIDWPTLRRQRRPLALHYALVVLRSVVQFGFGQFLSLYMIRVRGLPFEAASVALATFFLSTSSGSFLGGAVADRYGGRRVIAASCVGSAPLLLAFMFLDGWISLLALFVGGTVLLMSIPVNVVMAQDLAPSQAGTTTALMMGFGWGLAGVVFVPAVGWLADVFGLGAVLAALAALPVLGLPLALALPGANDVRRGNA